MLLKKRVRAGHRDSAIKILNQVEKTLAIEPPNAPKLMLLKMSLEEKLDTLKTLDNEVVDLIEEEAALEEIEQVDKFKQSIYAVMIKIKDLATAPPTSCCGLHPLRSRSTRGRRMGISRVKLPKLILRVFNEDLTNWTRFWDSYESATHNNGKMVISRETPAVDSAFVQRGHN